MRTFIFILFLIASQGISIAQWNWETIGKMPIPVSGADAVVLDSAIYIIGGYSDSLDSDLDIIQVYYPETNQWGIAGIMNEKRKGSFAAIYNNSILICGGISQPDSISRNLLFMNPSEWAVNNNYDTSFYFNRTYASGAIIGDDLYLFGGFHILDEQNRIDTSYIIRYNLTNKNFTYKSLGLFNSENFPVQQMVVNYASDIYLMGGLYTGVSSRIYKFYTDSSKYSRIQYELIEPRAGGEAVVYNNKIYLIGGYNEANPALTTVEGINIYGDYLETFYFPDLNYARKDFAAVLFNDRIYVFGGKDGDDKQVSEVETIPAEPATTNSNKPKKTMKFSLNQNFPNPFNASTKITFTLAQQEITSLIIYSILGKPVNTLIDKKILFGQNSVTWDGKDDMGNMMPSGMYIYQLTTGKNITSKKMVLLK